jgi:membrane protein
MSLFDKSRHAVRRLLSAPVEELGGWARLARAQIQMWTLCVRRLQQNNAMAMSSALSFRTIFALVPTLVLMFLILKSLGVLENKKQTLDTLLERAGFSQIVVVSSRPGHAAGATAPAAGAPTGEGESATVALADRITSVVDRFESQLTVGRLGPIGVVLLIWTVITLLTTIERSLNRIFEAPRSRPIGHRIVLYWSAVSLGPLALIAAGYLGDIVVADAEKISLLRGVLGLIAWVAPVVVGILVLGGVYKLLPNTAVSYKAAVAGAVLAVPLWLVARWGFSLYIRDVGSKSIYGALGLVPLFLMWLNLSWWIFLLGGQVAHTAGNLARMQSAEQAKERMLGPWDLLAAVVAVAGRNERTGKPVAVADVSGELGLSDGEASRLMHLLAKEGLVARTRGEDVEEYLLSRPAGAIRVTDVLAVGQSRPARGKEVAEAMQLVRSRSREGIADVTVADLALSD